MSTSAGGVQREDSGADDPTFTALARALHAARSIAVLTGAGISAESGIPTFRGAGGFWRQYDATELANPQAFAADPSLVWEFYHYRREIVSAAEPNAGHRAIAELQRRCVRQGKDFALLTQNIDGLHQRAGSTGVVNLHGSLWGTRCRRCGHREENRTMPICPALAGKGLPDASEARIPTLDLPRCAEAGCNGLLRPDVVWFGENLDREIIQRADAALESCHVLLVVGTSAIVYPAAGYAPMVRARGGTVAEFNIEPTGATSVCQFAVTGKAGVTLPRLLTAMDSLKHGM
ncbi:Sirtuin [Klebsormidium nitens]|uniref:NAD-dependent protein deacylase n=1 Tax=Klebsormidium nitens TaxID=105231 RepID=A0A1Y1HKA1_KLENI|nr:Sirtuin [Klebsormidium nitens]|eukprot:GAQ78363.1 Sirtuin [Klebsormidium nitens]